MVNIIVSVFLNLFINGDENCQTYNPKSRRTRIYMRGHADALGSIPNICVFILNQFYETGE